MSVAIGLIIGAVLGLTGAGGSIFAVPLLILFATMAPSEAMGVALGAVTVSALLGAAAQHKSVLWTPAIILAAGGILAAPLGKYFSLRINDTLLIGGFFLIAIFIAVRMLVSAIRQPEFARHLRANLVDAPLIHESLACRLSPTGEFQLKPRCLGGLSFGGAAIGFASGLFGVGGGFLIVPLLLYLSALSMQRAIATSLAVITLISASGFASHLILGGYAELGFVTEVLFGAVFGMLISQGVGTRLAGPVLQIIFSLLLFLVAIALLVSHLTN